MRRTSVWCVDPSGFPSHHELRTALCLLLSAFCSLPSALCLLRTYVAGVASVLLGTPCEGYVDGHTAALARLGLDRDAAPDELEPPLHAVEAEAGVPAVRGRGSDPRRRVEPAPLVLHDDGVGAVARLHPHAGRLHPG